MSSIFQFAKNSDDSQVKENSSLSSTVPRKDSNIFSFANQNPIEEDKEEDYPFAPGQRHLLRSEARIAETILGAPRAFGEFLEGIVPEKLISKGAEKIGLKQPVEKGFQVAKKYAPYKLFPTSEDVREFGKKLFGEKLEPKNPAEAKADEIIADATALALPIAGNKIKLLKPALISLGGNIAEDLARRVGASEKAQTSIKLGTFLFGSLINPKGIKNLENSLYEEARSARPKNATIKATNLSKNVTQFKSDLLKGGLSPSKTKTLSKLDEIQSAIKNGKIEIEELEKFKQSLNEARSGLYEEFGTNKVGAKLAKANLDKASKIVDDGLYEYGKVNPAWEAYYRPANEVHGAIAQSKRAQNFLIRNYKRLGAPSALALFGIEQAAGPLVTGAASVAGLGALKTGELAAKIYKSPTLTKYYINVLESALKDDVIAAEQNLKKLEKALQDENK